MDYIETRVALAGGERPAELAEILTAELAELGYESFETPAGELRAYIAAGLLDDAARAGVDDALRAYGLDPAAATHTAMPRQDWNSEWEKNYPPVAVGDFCRIRAPFHAPSAPGEYRHELTITPKMSFGTGHHATTALMIRAMSRLDLAGLRVLDMGSGTGVLAILAAKMGARSAQAVDIDPWAAENAAENARANGVAHAVECLLGDTRAGGPADVVLANINRNVLLEAMPTLAGRTAPGGRLLMSGFYDTDQEIIAAEAQARGLQPDTRLGHDHWACLTFRKP